MAGVILPTMQVVERSGQIKAITFDLGNVLLTNDYPYNTPAELTQFCDHFGVTLDNADTAFSEAFPPYSIGRTTEEQFWEEYLYIARAQKQGTEAIEDARRIYRVNQKENEGMLSFADSLKGDFRLAVLSTIPKEWLDFKQERFGLRDRFHPIISSGYTGLAKPDPRIYKRLLDDLGLEGPEVLFIDDRKTVLGPAQELGINTVVFRGRRDLEATLKQQLGR